MGISCYTFCSLWIAHEGSVSSMILSLPASNEVIFPTSSPALWNNSRQFVSVRSLTLPSAIIPKSMAVVGHAAPLSGTTKSLIRILE